MPTMDLIPYLLKLEKHTLSKNEQILLEIKLFTEISREIQHFFSDQYKDYLKLIQSKPVQEENMLNGSHVKELIKDILSTEEYSLSGIANQIKVPQDVLLDLISGVNTNPTFELARRIFELHISIRRNLYDAIMRKVVSEYLKT